MVLSGCWPAVVGILDRIAVAVRARGLRLAPVRLRIRISVLAVAPGARRNTREILRGQGLLLQLEIENKHRVLFTGSDVLIEQMEKYGEQIPFLATIKKIDRFYTLS